MQRAKALPSTPLEMWHIRVRFRPVNSQATWTHFSLLTSVSQQGFVKELCSWAEVFGDIHIWKIIHFNAQVLDIETIVETWSCVDTCAMSCIQDMGDPQSLQTAFVHCNASAEKEKRDRDQGSYFSWGKKLNAARST